VGLGTTLFTRDDGEFNIITLTQGLVSLSLDGTEVTKHIGTAIAPDEAVSLRIVEPLYLPRVLRHVDLRSADRGQRGCMIYRPGTDVLIPVNAKKEIQDSFFRLSRFNQKVSNGGTVGMRMENKSAQFAQ
jgi:hypothetical protein